MSEEKSGVVYAEKCPACHTSIKPGSYRCPRCKIYFCIKCGKHLRRYDTEYCCQSANCPYKNAPICSECMVIIGEYKAFRLLKWLDKDYDKVELGCPGCGVSAGWKPG